jgi:hypothetical protein
MEEYKGLHPGTAGNVKAIEASEGKVVTGAMGGSIVVLGEEGGTWSVVGVLNTALLGFWAVDLYGTQLAKDEALYSTMHPGMELKDLRVELPPSDEEADGTMLTNCMGGLPRRRRGGGPWRRRRRCVSKISPARAQQSFKHHVTDLTRVGHPNSSIVTSIDLCDYLDEVVSGRLDLFNLAVC